ncbi:unnamed protein product [Musa acuminata subsp. malaccensis]|uniref:(wild Malaysian banana) hypothetical protein n=1 Tax=Musa acuminata subsp. malaccensis TaxID=214687 RepID=A0A804I7E4_MUSAM|nr:unnamed protein product [Musa acuminata subsp. malaccensis]
MAANPSTYSPSQSSETRQQKRRLFQKTDWTRCRPACLYPLSLCYALELFDVLPTRRTLEELTLCRAALGTGAANSASGSAYPAFGATTVIVSVFFDEPLLTLQRPELYFHNPLRTCTEQDNDNSTNRSLHISTIAQKAAAECMRWCGSSKKLKLKQKCELSLVLQSI